MKSLDYEYLGELLKLAQSGDSTAFAELYAATYSRQFTYAYQYLDSEYLAKDAVRKIYTRALKEIHSLQTPQLFMAWLNRISFQVCYEMMRQKDSPGMENDMVKIGAAQYSLGQIMRLPLTEAQVLIQHYYQKIPVRESARSLDVSKNSVNRYLHIGRLHLKKLMQVRR
jgi:RNA polymerase sigma-70 factor (ECF subfamily)